MKEVCNYPHCTCPIDKTDICIKGYAEPSNYTQAQIERMGKKASKYHKQVKGVQIDVYDVLKAFNVTNPADAHAIKKMLCPGQRGVKDAIQDRREAIQSLERAIELESE